MIEVHSVQFGQTRDRKTAVVPTVVSLRAYEVYCHLHGEQPAMITGHCRGGLSVGELLCFLYAHSFPKSEWQARYDEASKGMTVR